MLSLSGSTGKHLVSYLKCGLFSNCQVKLLSFIPIIYQDSLIMQGKCKSYLLLFQHINSLTEYFPGKYTSLDISDYLNSGSSGYACEALRTPNSGGLCSQMAVNNSCVLIRGLSPAFTQIRMRIILVRE